VTVRAILGLAALNGAYAVLGVALLWAIRGLPRWTDVLRLAGLGYLLGVAAFGVVWTQLLVVGVPLGGWGVVLSLACGTAAAAFAAVLLGRQRPRGFGDPERHASPFAVLVTAAGVSLSGLLLEALFRSARLQGLQAYDAWAFWVPKGKAIYFFGGLDEQVFTTFPGPTYPPLVPILDAASFHAMGGADTITFHLQFWFFVLGAVAAIAGLLYRHVSAWLLWPALLLVLTVPRVASHLLIPQADVLVDIFFVVGEGADRSHVLATMARLRAHGLAADTDYAGRSKKGQLTQAARLGAKTTVVVEADGARIARPGGDEPTTLEDLAASLGA